jgi:hypothetical protein
LAAPMIAASTTPSTTAFTVSSAIVDSAGT